MLLVVFDVFIMASIGVLVMVLLLLFPVYEFDFAHLCHLSDGRCVVLVSLADRLVFYSKKAS